MPYLTPSSVPTDKICRTLRIPNSPFWLSIVSGALLELSRQYNWEEEGVSISAAVLASMEIFDSYMESTACMIGAVIPYVSTDPPTGTLACDGATYNRVDYPSLYDTLDPIFVIDASTFRVPDLRGRACFGSGEGISLTAKSIGETGGIEMVELQDGENAPHSHTMSVPITTIIVQTGVSTPVLMPVQTPINTGVSGGGDPHQNMPPWLALNYCIVAR